MSHSLKNFRAADPGEQSLVGSGVTISQKIRLMARSLSIFSAYVDAITQYCRDYFDQNGIDDISERHRIVLTLRREISFATLVSIYVDSPMFREAFLEETGSEAPTVANDDHGTNSTKYAQLLSGFVVPTEQEERFGDVANANAQRVKKIAKCASEVGLIDYIYESKNRVKYIGRKELHDFFGRYLNEKI